MSESWCTCRPKSGTGGGFDQSGCPVHDRMERSGTTQAALLIASGWHPGGTTETAQPSPPESDLLAAAVAEAKKWERLYDDLLRASAERDEAMQGENVALEVLWKKKRELAEALASVGRLEEALRAIAEHSHETRPGVPWVHWREMARAALAGGTPPDTGKTATLTLVDLVKERLSDGEGVIYDQMCCSEAERVQLRVDFAEAEAAVDELQARVEEAEQRYAALRHAVVHYLLDAEIGNDIVTIRYALQTVIDTIEA